MLFKFKPGIPNRGILLLPLLGMLVFLILYVVAALKYPGGSWKVPEASGFSFWNNYLCDLLDDYAVNGMLNDARYFARAALAFLCSSILLIWILLPRLFPKPGLNQTIMWVSGILALGATYFLSSGNHDVTLRIAGLFGLVAFIACLIELLRAGYFKHFSVGFLSLVIFVINYIIYETGIFIEALPSIQKFTFLCCMLWFLMLNISLIRSTGSDLAKSDSAQLK